MQPKVYTSEDHHIRNELIDSNALFVLQKLHEAGFIAYLVGGSVRDLLMRKKPKDFDISTSAQPEEVRALFPRSLLIGRRFRLVHVRFGKQFIEVSTFRAGDPAEEELIIRDNIWGTPEEDVMRRDFTINGLFYDPLDNKIIDYVGGFEDLKAHTLRVIGDPMIRFKQDPVRMIRMQKFRARFGFHVQPEAIEALNRCRGEITKSSSARVLEELFRMLESGASEPFFRLLSESEFLGILFPQLHPFFQHEIGESVYAYLRAADSMNQKSGYRALDRSVLIAALIFPILEHEIHTRYIAQEQYPQLGDIIDLSANLIQDLLFLSFSHFPRKIRQDCHSILQMQYRLTPFEKRGHPRTRILRQQGFLQALTFLKLRALINHDLFSTYEHWKTLRRKAEQEKKEKS